MSFRMRMECIECGQKFTARLRDDATECQCPKCGGYDTEPAEVF